MKLLNVRGISKSFFGVSALKDVNFDLMRLLGRMVRVKAL